MDTNSEILQAIFTPYNGEQKIRDYRIDFIPPIHLKSPEHIEQFLIKDYAAELAERNEDGTIKAGEALEIISTCIYSDNLEKWAHLYADGWSGRFHYPTGSFHWAKAFADAK